MHKAAPMSFGARLASLRLTREEAAWFFNVPLELAADGDQHHVEPADPAAKIQIGPLDT